MPKKLAKDLTKEEIKAICLKARTIKNGATKVWCTKDCPLYESNIRICDILHKLNQEIEVKEDE